jgi:hypothetical protein
MESEFTAQSPLESARSLKSRLASVKKANYGGATLCIYGVANRLHLQCLESKLDPRVRLQKTISTQPVVSGSCAESVDFYHFPIIQ